MSTTISKSEFARRIKVRPSRITAMISEGVLSPPAVIGTGRRSRIDPVVAERQIAARVDSGPVRDGRRADPALLKARIKRAQAEAVRSQIAQAREALELAALQGEVVPIDAITALVAEEYTAVRSKLLAAPSKLAQQLAAESEPARCHAILAEAIHEVLTELAADAEATIARAGKAAG